MKRLLLPLLAAIATVNTSNAAANATSIIEEMTIIGSQQDVRKVAGSGSVIGSEQIALEISTDINQLLKTVPGVYVREEDGYGLRPNFGIRGATSERSEKITVMEGGVLIAPAPYSNPSAYYFPTATRMKGVEVLKGAPLLRYGPQTVGGVVNMISTAIPESNSGSVTLAAGENSGIDLLASYGGRNGAFGWLVETVQRESDGFKDIDRSSRDSGYDIQDYMVKLGWEGESQSVLFKAQRSEETSNETYLGLTDADFDRDENRRYGLSSIDEMNNKHEGFNLSHKLNINDSMAVTTTAYYNEFARDWFKLSGGGKIVAAANGGDAESQGILDGDIDASGLKYKHNNRSYLSKGIQSELAFNIDEHSLHFGVRVHRDEMDRFQPQERYDQVGGQLVYVSTDSVTGSNNRLETAEATSIWLVDSWQASEKLLLNMALRYEDVETSRRQFSTQNRSDAPSKRSNSTSEWLPGLSATYQLDGNWQALAGVHRGFSPLGGGAKSEEEPETSINYEAGLRYATDQWFVEGIGFWSDFENKAENCSNANPCSNGATSGSYVTGDALIAGLELQFSSSFALGSMTVPVDIAYTYTKAEVSEDNTTEGLFDGDQLANIPDHSFSIRSGIETAAGWSNYVNIKYIDETCVNIACGGSFGETESFVNADLISHYVLNEAVTVFLKIENVFDKQAIVSRSPDGARPNKDRTASVGFSMNF